MGFHTDQHISSVVIAGAGGFGLEVCDALLQLQGAGGPTLAGFIDDTPGLALGEDLQHPLLGRIDTFVPRPGQVVVVAIGSVAGRQAVLRRLWARGIETPAFVAHGAIVSPNATLAPGAIVCPLSVVARRARLGAGSLVNVHASVGHGASVGNFSVLSPYAALNGDAAVGARCFLGTRATINPKVQLGDDCVVDSHCAVRQSLTQGRAMVSCRGTYQVTPSRPVEHRVDA